MNISCMTVAGCATASIQLHLIGSYKYVSDNILGKKLDMQLLDLKSYLICNA